MKNKKLYNMLFEKDNQTIATVDQGSTTQPQNYSLDERVDKFLIQYERESNPQSAQDPAVAMNNTLVAKGGSQGAGVGFGGGASASATPISLSEKKKRKGVFSMIWEQEDPLGGVGGDAGGDLGDAGGGLGDLGGDVGGDDTGEGSAPTPPPVAKPQINLSVFTGKVARLINNFESLVDPKTILVNRAYTFLRQGYDEKTAKEFLITLENSYEISNKSKSEKRDEVVGEIPAAAGAGDSSGGSSGA